MITVAILEVTHPSTLQKEKIYVTSGVHYVITSSTEVIQCLPLITGSFRFGQSILDNSLTEFSSSVEEGSLTLTNLSGVLDKYKDYGFLGNSVYLYRIADENTVKTINESSADFIGTLGVPEMGWEEWSIPILSRLRNLDIPLTQEVFTEQDVTVIDPETHFTGDASVEGKLKPLLLGRCFGIQPVLLNSHLLLYGCNFIKGNPARAIIHSVYSKGGEFAISHDEPDILSLLSTGLLPGHYATCERYGLFRLGSVPTGTVTVDASSSGFLDLSVPEVVRALYSIAYDPTWQAGWDLAALDSLGLKDSVGDLVPCGYYITSDVTILEVLKALLQSIGVWCVPDAKGTLRFGKLEGTPSSSVTTFTADHFLRGSMKRLPYKTLEGVPIQSLEFQHTRNWTIIQDPLPALSLDRKRTLAKEWDSYTITSSNHIKSLHPLSGSETITSLLCVAPPKNYKDTDFYGVPFTGWWNNSGGDPNWPQAWKNDGTGILLPSLMIQSVGSPIRIYHEPGMYVNVEYARLNAAGPDPIVKFFIDYSATPIPFSLGGAINVPMTLSKPLRDVMGPRSYPDGYNHELGIIFENGSFTSMGIAKVYTNRPLTEQAVRNEAIRRHRILAGVQDCYEFVVPLDLALQVDCGSGITLKDFRMNLDNGVDFTVISKEEDWELEEVTLTVWRSDYVYQ